MWDLIFFPSRITEEPLSQLKFKNKWLIYFSLSFIEFNQSNVEGEIVNFIQPKPETSILVNIITYNGTVPLSNDLPPEKYREPILSKSSAKYFDIFFVKIWFISGILMKKPIGSLLW